MRGHIKYNFEDVLVADTKLLVNINNTDKPPQILMLNSNLSKCHTADSNCVSCCLKADGPEFRHRSSLVHAESKECFASCSERRPISIELTAKTQFRGKLVLLAMTRTEILSNKSHPTSLSPFYRCLNKNTWYFSKFEPSSLITTGKQTFYSRLNQNQVPSMVINSMDIYYNSSKRKEIVSLAIQSNLHRKNQHVLAEETLFIIEMDCHFERLNTSLFGEIILKHTNKMNLLVLINKETPSATSEDKLNSDISTILEITQESLIDYPLVAVSQSKRAATVQTQGRSHSLYEESGLTKQTSIDEKVISSADSLKSLVINPQNRIEVRLRNNSRTGPTYITEFDSFRSRLISDSFLFLTVPSCFMILTFTLCLFIYLKSRQKFRPKGSKMEIRPIPSDILTPKSPTENESRVFNISEPYNLQMPQTTRDRLERMLSKSSHKARNTADTRLHYRPESRLDGYGTINVVRAIREATTLARTRFRSSLYRPNLNVIQESDMEYLQSSNVELELFANFLNKHSEKGRVQQGQLEALVRNAMSPDCSHITGKIYYKQQTATLFSKPIEKVTTGELISRSRILWNVKQDNL